MEQKDKSFYEKLDSDWEIDVSNEDKTPKEILMFYGKIDCNGEIHVFPEEIEFCFEEYGRQQQNKAIRHSVKIITDFYGDKGLTNTGNAIKNEVLKLLK